MMPNDKGYEFPVRIQIIHDLFRLEKWVDGKGIHEGKDLTWKYLDNIVRAFKGRAQTITGQSSGTSTSHWVRDDDNAVELLEDDGKGNDDGDTPLEKTNDEADANEEANQQDELENFMFSFNNEILHDFLVGLNNF